MTESDVLALAQHALDLVGTDPREALREADDVLTVARPRVSPEAVSTAQRAAALALKEMGDLRSAERRLRAGLRSTAGHSARAEAEARMSLAFILLERGHAHAALAQADRAATSLSGVEGARLLGQRALVLQRCGHVTEALAAYGKALPVLRRAGDDTWESTLLNNRGLLHAYRGSLVQASKDLQRSRTLVAREGERLNVAGVDWNLGFVAAMAGDLPEALARYDSAEDYYDREGLSVARILLDRSAVLLQAGLLDEARQVLTRAVDELTQSRADADAAEGLVALAQVALAQGDSAAAAGAARLAVRLMTRQGRPGWTLLARQVLFTAEVDGLEPKLAARRGVRLAALLRDAGWREEEQEVLLLSTRAAIADGDLRHAAELLGRASSVRHARAAAVRYRVWYQRALLRAAQGRLSSALGAVVSGLSALDEQRALLGATELRAQVGGQASDLSALGLRLAVQEGKPSRILHIAELSRAGSLRLRPVRPPRDAELAEALAELRQATTAEVTGRVDDQAVRGIAGRTRAAETKVRRLTRQARGLMGAVGAPVQPVTDVLSALGSRALAEYVVIGDDLHLITGVDGWVRHRRLASVAAVSLEVETLRFALQRLTSAMTPRVVTAHDEAAQRLQDLVLAPAPELDGRELVISPAGVLQGMAWASLPRLREVAVSVTPSASLWFRGAQPEGVSAPTRVVLAAGPGLPAAAAEVRASAAFWPAALVIDEGAATVGATLELLEGSSIAHVAAHGRLRTDNPLLSSLEMADGPLTVYDLERLDRVPAVVVLPACRSAVSTVRSGEELLGLAAAFLALGTHAVIASMIPVPDEVTAAFMPRLHAELSRGVRPAQALTAARAAHRASGSEWATASSFVCLGCG